MFVGIRPWKKKAKFIIDPQHHQDAQVKTSNQAQSETPADSSATSSHQTEAEAPVDAQASKVEEVKQPIRPVTEIKAFTIASLAKERELVKNTEFQTIEKAKYEVRPFSETDMLLQWNKYVHKMEEQGNMNLNAILSMNEPKLQDNFVISYSVPNDSVKYEIERNKTPFLGYLRGMLHNHDIQLELVVSEEAKLKRFYTPEDKYNHFKSLNPDIELLRQTFGLDF